MVEEDVIAFDGVVDRFLAGELVRVRLTADQVVLARAAGIHGARR